MSVRDFNRKLCVKGNVEPTCSTLELDSTMITCQVPLWKIALANKIEKILDEQQGLELWFGYMKE